MLTLLTLSPHNLSEVLAHNHFNFFFLYSANVTSEKENNLPNLEVKFSQISPLRTLVVVWMTLIACPIVEYQKSQPRLAFEFDLITAVEK